MAVPMRIPVSFGDVFPHGAFVLGVEADRDFDAVKAGHPDPQVRDKETGARVWVVRVLDAAPDLRVGQAEVKVKIAVEHQPVPPDLLPGTPFRPAEFDGLTITAYVDQSRKTPRVGYSLRASGMRAPGGARPAKAA
ncbi:plasmid replication, integration and excision activator [Parafrankia soli]|uniref:Plasmid replication, integration and excision activator n=1 Tax=Parafrankia soli TaxID=2599596 RepID=A0A1S1QM34_9ACTN|nr:plasmid replication, integration and excision activator [Parafrankia soli]OHV34491.1 plasmid replication, integration and excision activator [Parafrankia soli]